MRSPLTIIEPPVVLAQTEPNRHNKRPVTVIWDVDGTLVLGDTLMPFLRRFTGTTALASIVMGAGLRRIGMREWRSATKSAVLTAVLAGREVAAVDDIAHRYVSDLVMLRLRPDCLRRWQWHRAQGHRLVLASASPQLYLKWLGSLLGAEAVIGTEMAVADGRLTGLLATPNCRGEQKAARVRQFLGARPSGPVWVYANGRIDRPTLALADVPVRVRPYRSLRPAAGTVR